MGLQSKPTNLLPLTKCHFMTVVSIKLPCHRVALEHNETTSICTPPFTQVSGVNDHRDN